MPHSLADRFIVRNLPAAISRGFGEYFKSCSTFSRSRLASPSWELSFKIGTDQALFFSSTFTILLLLRVLTSCAWRVLKD